MTMFPRHVTRELAALLDGELAPESVLRVDSHLEDCTRCNAELADVRFGMSMLHRLPAVAAPPDLWRQIDATLDRSQLRPASAWPAWRFAWAAALILAIAAGLWTLARQPRPEWEVTRLEGRTRLSSLALTGTAKAGAGSEISTGADGRARIRVGEIGTVDVEPNTQVRLIGLGSRNHRLALRSGSLFANIAAPPRMFFVETPSGTAVDLGCEYKLECDRAGNGSLRVTAGWVALAWRGRESLVPAGASCRTRAQIGPGTPFFDDAPIRLVNALDSFDLQRGGAVALDVILQESRVRDTLTLWHLLARVDFRRRSEVYEKMAALSPPPPSVLREQVLRLDADTLKRWKEELAWTW